MEETQIASFGVSILALLSCIVLAFFKKNARIFYFAMSVSWMIGIVFYYKVLFLGGGGHQASALVRLSQYILFSGWFIMDALEKIILSFAKKKKR